MRSPTTKELPWTIAMKERFGRIQNRKYQIIKKLMGSLPDTAHSDFSSNQQLYDCCIKRMSA